MYPLVARASSAARAISLDGQLAEAQASLGHIFVQQSRDWVGGERQYRHAFNHLGRVYNAMGEAGKAVQVLEGHPGPVPGSFSNLGRAYALAALEGGEHDMSQMIGFLNSEPGLDSIRDEPRFRAVSQRLRLG